MALVSVLWAVALLAAIAAVFAAGRRADSAAARHAVGQARAEALADAGVHAAILGLRQPDRELAWQPDGRPYRLALGGGEVVVTVRDEAGKIDLNTGSRRHLARLLMLLDVPEAAALALVDAIDDFRDADDLRRTNGAEAEDYRRAGLPYGPANTPLKSIEDVAFVLGMTPELMRRLAPNVTVYTGRRAVDPAVAPPLVRQAAAADELAPAGGRGTGGRGWRQTFAISGTSTIDGYTFSREAVVRLTSDHLSPYGIVRWHRIAGGAMAAGE